MIHYACPLCNTTFQASEERAGSKLTCPACGQRLQVPELGASPHGPRECPAPVRPCMPPPRPGPPVRGRGHADRHRLILAPANAPVRGFTLSRSGLRRVGDYSPGTARGETPAPQEPVTPRVILAGCVALAVAATLLFLLTRDNPGANAAERHGIRARRPFPDR